MPNRKLAAILFADIFGYTALMQKDEEHAARLHTKFHHEVAITVEKYNGRIINDYGDGVLCTFDSNLRAARCSIDLQNKFMQEPHVPVRIGLHSGSIVFKDDKVYGDSINIASRIESTGIPGSILLSEKVQDDIKNQTELQTVSLGLFDFKNVQKSIEVFALSNPGLEVPKRKDLSGKLKKSKRNPFVLISIIVVSVFILGLIFIKAGIFKKESEHTDETTKSIAVLDFEYIGNTDEFAYLAKGFPSAIVEKLSSIEDLRISPHTSIEYFVKNEFPLNQVNEILNVSYYLKGFVQKSRDDIMVRVQLFDAAKDSMCWSQTRPFTVDSLFNEIDNVASIVASNLKLSNFDNVVFPSFPLLSSNVEAYNLYKKGEFFLTKYTSEDLLTAIDYFGQARNIDAEFAEAYVMEAFCHIFLAGYIGGKSSRKALKEAKPLLNKALKIDPNSPSVYSALSIMHWWLEWDYEAHQRILSKAKEHGFDLPPVSTYIQIGKFKAALDVASEQINDDPLNPWNYWPKGTSLFLNGMVDEALETYEEGLSLFPYHSDLYWEAGRVFISAGKVDRGIEVLEKGLELMGGKAPNLLAYLSIANYQKGRTEEAIAILKELETRWKNKELGLAFYIAHIYCALGDFERTFEWLDMAYDDHELEMVWLKVEPQFRPLHNDPRFIELVNKVGFPKIE